MINPKTRYHPEYDLTDEIRQAYPKESKHWEELLFNVEEPEKKGCFTCRFYNPPENTFPDIEFIDDNDQYPLPWDTEQAYVNCDKFAQEQTSLRINCPLWKVYRTK